MSSWVWKGGFAGVVIVAATAYAVAQMPPGHGGMHGQTGQDQQGMPPQSAMHSHMMQMMQGGKGPMHGGMMHRQAGAPGMTGQPTMPGQDAFGTIQEIVQILEADPSTDWSKVNIGALRQHLIDMNEVTLHAVATERALDNGVEIAVTGEGRTLEAIKRMVPAHVSELAKMGWKATTQELPDGVKLVVVDSDPKQVTRLKALGFMGIMVQGGHHQPHHLMMARGELPMH